MDLTQQLIYLTHSKETFSTTRTTYNFNRGMCLFIVAGRGSSGLPPSVMLYLIFFTFANYTYHGEDRKNSPTDNSVRQTLDIEKFCSILIRFCILSDPPPSIYTCNLLSSYSVMNTPNKTCWEKIRGGGIEKKIKIKSLFKKKPMTRDSVISKGKP